MTTSGQLRSPVAAHHRAWRLPAARVVGIGTAVALGVDAFVHLNDASQYADVKSSVLSQSTLFRVEAIAAIAVGIGVLLRPRLVAFVLAAFVSASAAGAVLLYTYVNFGALGPLPNMYEPTWNLPGKAASAVAELIGTALSLIGIGLYLWHRRRTAPIHEAN